MAKNPTAAPFCAGRFRWCLERRDTPHVYAIGEAGSEPEVKKKGGIQRSSAEGAKIAKDGKGTNFAVR